MSDEPGRAAVAAIAAGLRETVVCDTGTVPLDAIDGRRLAEPVVASAPLPAHDYATMDGFAVATGDGLPLSIRGRDIGPDDDQSGHEPGTATPIATGAPLPRGADAVVPEEDARVVDGTLRGPRAGAGSHVIGRGSHVGAGETVLARGTVLSARNAALLRDLGRERVVVERPLSVGVVATGDEVAADVQPDRDSEAVAGLVRRWGHEATIERPIPDDPAVLRERLAALAADHDVLVTSGGTSVGSGDHTVDALADLGTVVQRGIALRPGRPVACVRLDEYDAVGVALPGKPVAAYVATVAVVAPLVGGERSHVWRTATAACDLALPEAPIEYALPVVVEDGTAIPVGSPASDVSLYDDRYRPGRVAACPRVLGADGIVFRTEPLAAGERLRWTPFAALEAL
ncbi:molybdopterin molybdotransferase MoeA [Haloplanus rallus]|uniref:molybdopterin molybdotransferase MoeA n=1 Tax=Haloplanus rallus TaxID=1816183 RepID=UPI0012FDDE96|nr:molybdopterin-binding protein [Haloplanus rallus]